VGVKTTARLIERIRATSRRAAHQRRPGPRLPQDELKKLWPAQDRALAAPRKAHRHPHDRRQRRGQDHSIAKLCHTLRQQNKSVILGACDTFRAGAVKQLEVWSQRLGVEVIKVSRAATPRPSPLTPAPPPRPPRRLPHHRHAGRLQTQDPSCASSPRSAPSSRSKSKAPPRGLSSSTPLRPERPPPGRGVQQVRRRHGIF